MEGYKIIRTKSAKVFDELAAFTASLFNTEIAVISFVDQHNIWKKRGQQHHRFSWAHVETNVCSLAIANDSVGAFEGLFATPALITNALIASELGMCFYVAVPILNDEGIRIGSVCIVDKKRREFLPQEQEKLEWVADMVKNEMSKRTTQMICV